MQGNSDYDGRDLGEQVRLLIHELNPGLIVEVRNDREILVNNRRIDLDNLRRLIEGQPGSADEIIRHYIDTIFGNSYAPIEFSSYGSSYRSIMPRLQPVSIFENLNSDEVLHTSWVEGIVCVMVEDRPDMTISLTNETRLEWDKTVDEIHQQALENLGELPLPRLNQIDCNDGGRAIVIQDQDGYDASRILDERVRRELRSLLGTEFFAAVPSRDLMIAFSNSDRLIEKLSERICEDFTRQPYPISDQLLLVVPDGVVPVS